MSMPFWLQFIFAFLIVVGALAVAFGINEWWQWRKDERE